MSGDTENVLKDGESGRETESVAGKKHCLRIRLNYPSSPSSSSSLRLPLPPRTQLWFFLFLSLQEKGKKKTRIERLRKPLTK